MEEGFGWVSGKNTWHEALEEAIEAYKEKFGQEPDTAYVDDRLWPDGLKLEGIFPLEGAAKGLVILLPG